jgi:Tfp pilus assembly protein FimT
MRCEGRGRAVRVNIEVEVQRDWDVDRCIPNS